MSPPLSLSLISTNYEDYSRLGIKIQFFQLGLKLADTVDKCTAAPAIKEKETECPTIDDIKAKFKGKNPNDSC